MNSTRDPTSQSFCTGVWHETGKSTYELNHFTLSWDGNHNFVDPGQIQESITLTRWAMLVPERLPSISMTLIEF
jgi:hypothetical protein